MILKSLYIYPKIEQKFHQKLLYLKHEFLLNLVVQYLPIHLPIMKKNEMRNFLIMLLFIF